VNCRTCAGECRNNVLCGALKKSDNLWSFGMPEADAELKVEYEDINYRTLDFTPSTDDYKLRVITGPSPLIDVDPILKKVEPGREVIVAVNMTDEAKKIINCIYESRGRYGKNIIMDTVLGAKTARLAEIGASEYKSYGVLESSNKNLLRRLIEELLLEGYIQTGEYQVLKLGDISN